MDQQLSLFDDLDSSNFLERLESELSSTLSHIYALSESLGLDGISPSLVGINAVAWISYLQHVTRQRYLEEVGSLEGFSSTEFARILDSRDSNSCKKLIKAKGERFDTDLFRTYCWTRT